MAFFKLDFKIIKFFKCQQKMNKMKKIPNFLDKKFNILNFRSFNECQNTYKLDHDNL